MQAISLSHKGKTFSPHTLRTLCSRAHSSLTRNKTPPHSQALAQLGIPLHPMYPPAMNLDFGCKEEDGLLPFSEPQNNQGTLTHSACLSLGISASTSQVSPLAQFFFWQVQHWYVYQFWILGKKNDQYHQLHIVAPFPLHQKQKACLTADSRNKRLHLPARGWSLERTNDSFHKLTSLHLKEHILFLLPRPSYILRVQAFQIFIITWNPLNSSMSYLQAA